MSQGKSVLKSLIRDMSGEILLLKSFIKVEEELSRTVQSRDWDCLEKILEELNRIAAKIERIEEKRDDRYNCLKADLKLEKNDTFQSVLSRLSKEQKSELEPLQLEIKKNLLSVKSFSEGLIYYCKYMHDSTNQILGELFPHRKGRIYTDRGRASGQREEPVLVNHER